VWQMEHAVYNLAYMVERGMFGPRNLTHAHGLYTSLAALEASDVRFPASIAVLRVEASLLALELLPEGVGEALIEAAHDSSPYISELVAVTGVANFQATAMLGDPRNAVALLGDPVQLVEVVLPPVLGVLLLLLLWTVLQKQRSGADQGNELDIVGLDGQQVRVFGHPLEEEQQVEYCRQCDTVQTPSDRNVLGTTSEAEPLDDRGAVGDGDNMKAREDVQSLNEEQHVEADGG